MPRDGRKSVYQNGVTAPQRWILWPFLNSSRGSYYPLVPQGNMSILIGDPDWAGLSAGEAVREMGAFIFFEGNLYNFSVAGSFKMQSWQAFIHQLLKICSWSMIYGNVHASLVGEFSQKMKPICATSTQTKK